jgi:RNA polymerase sigma factor (sigma-70 family)
MAWDATTAAEEARGERSNAEWCRLVADRGAAGEAARRELRALMVSAIRRVLRARGAGEDLSEDLAQEAMMRVSGRLDRFRGESRFTTWALAIAMRVAFDELRRARWKDVPLDALAAEETPGPPAEAAPGRSPERAMARDRVLASLSEAIDRDLTERQRAVLRAELEGMPQAEIAMRLAMTRNALYKLSHDARRKVRARLEAAGITAADVIWVFE